MPRIGGKFRDIATTAGCPARCCNWPARRPRLETEDEHRGSPGDVFCRAPVSPSYRRVRRLGSRPAALAQRPRLRGRLHGDSRLHGRVAGSRQRRHHQRKARLRPVRQTRSPRNVTAVLTTFPLWIIATFNAVINSTGSGDCFRIYCPTLFTGGNFLPRLRGRRHRWGQFSRRQPQGTGAVGGSTSATSSASLASRGTELDGFRRHAGHADNTWFWTEEMRLRVMAYNCVSSDGTAVPVVLSCGRTWSKAPTARAASTAGAFDIYTVSGLSPG